MEFGWSDHADGFAGTARRWRTGPLCLGACHGGFAFPCCSPTPLLSDARTGVLNCRSAGRLIALGGDKGQGRRRRQRQRQRARRVARYTMREGSRFPGTMRISALLARPDHSPRGSSSLGLRPLAWIWREGGGP
jgi:hypothetical protein